MTPTSCSTRGRSATSPKRDGWGGLRYLAAGRRVILTDAVESELRQGASGRPHLQSALDARWLQRHVLSSDEEILAMSRFAERLVVGDRNIGECSVLAYASVHGAVAVVDDGAARKAAAAASVTCRGTLGLLVQAVHEGHLTVGMVSAVADHLIQTEYRLPFGEGGFVTWARRQGLFMSENT